MSYPDISQRIHHMGRHEFVRPSVYTAVTQPFLRALIQRSITEHDSDCVADGLLTLRLRDYATGIANAAKWLVSATCEWPTPLGEV